MIRGIAVSILAFLTLAAAVSASTSELDSLQKQRLVEAIGKRLEKKAYAFDTDFSKWKDFAAERSSEIEAAETKNDLARVLGDALGEFELSHLAIFSPETAKRQRAGRRTGIGITIHSLDEGGGIISYVLQDSPAEKSGLQKGDILLTIDGIPITEIQQLAGEVGVTRVVTLQRDGELLSCEIEYDEFPLSEKSDMYWAREDIAVIQIQSFQYRFYRAAKINRFFREARDARGIIVDLRNNRGGLSFYSRHLASKLSPSKDTFALLSRKSHEQSERNSKSLHPLPFSKHYRGKVVVLVDSLSASAADILPAFVAETERGTVIGERTSGALQLARTYQLPYGFRIYLPIAELLTPEGNRLENVGFQPEIELTLNETIDDNFILQKAVEVIEAD